MGFPPGRTHRRSHHQEESWKDPAMTPVPLLCYCSINSLSRRVHGQQAIQQWKSSAPPVFPVLCYSIFPMANSNLFLLLKPLIAYPTCSGCGG